MENPINTEQVNWKDLGWFVAPLVAVGGFFWHLAKFAIDRLDEKNEKQDEKLEAHEEQLTELRICTATILVKLEPIEQIKKDVHSMMNKRAVSKHYENEVDILAETVSNLETQAAVQGHQIKILNEYQQKSNQVYA